MNILPNYNYQCTTPQKPNFTAIPKANYKLFKDTGKVTVFQLEKSDIPFLEKIKVNIKDFLKEQKIEDESRQQVVEEAFSAGIKLLDKSNTDEKKAKIFLAVCNESPCGIIIGNASKTDKFGKVHYSSRKNHGTNETELDWLASWNNNLKGVGKSLVGEFFHSLKKDGFKSVYVRSEIPSKSGARDFYENVGYTLLNNTERLIQRKNDYSYRIGTYDALEDKILPMKATPKRINESIKNISEAMSREEIKNPKSCNLFDITNVHY